MLLLTELEIKAVIIDDGRREQCQARCGMDWSLPENQELARARLQDQCGGRVQLAYYDLASQAFSSDIRQLGLSIESKNLPLPLLILNGEPKISGPFDIRQLLDAIDAGLEIGSER